MNNLTQYIPINKVDEEKRVVYGVATDETPDTAGEIVDYEATKSAVEEWSKWRNIREMHGSNAVGVAEEIEFDDTAKAMSIAARVVDDAAWKKVKAGVYKGFSIGGKKMRQVREKSGLTRITKYKLFEVSLVDRPANPSAQFLLVKRRGGKMNLRSSLLKALEIIQGKPEAEALDLDELKKHVETLPDGDGAVVEEIVNQAIEAGAFAKAADVEGLHAGQAEAISQAVEGLAKADDLEAATGQVNQAMIKLDEVDGNLQKMLGDLAKTVAAVGDLQSRLETVETNINKSGPVLREIGMLGKNDEEVLKAIFNDTDDPQLRQVIGQRIARMQIQATQGNVISHGK